jgi:hypothetical protein
VKRDAVGIFTQESRGCGQGAVLNVTSDGGQTLNTPAESVSPGSFVSAYATGLGAVHFAPQDGYPAPRDPLPIKIAAVSVWLGLQGFVRSAPVVTYVGLAPDLVGVYQIDFRIPDDAPEGCGVPLTIWDSASMSQPVMISIRQRGGRCQDAPVARFASLRWRKTITTGPEQSAVSTQETFTATFAEGPENQVVPLVVPERRCPCPSEDYIMPEAPRCPGGGPRTLDAGALRLEGLPGGPIAVSPASSSGELIYTATLPAGSFRPGEVRVLGAGGPSVGAFRTGISIPAPIEITTPLPPGTRIPYLQPFRLTWRNGSPDALVRMKIVSPYPYGEPSLDCTALASDGEMTLGLIGPDPPRLPVLPSENAYLIVTVSPRAGQVQTFSAPGLTLGGKHEWSYEYRFYNLRIRSP